TSSTPRRSARSRPSPGRQRWRPGPPSRSWRRTSRSGPSSPRPRPGAGAAGGSRPRRRSMARSAGLARSAAAGRRRGRTPSPEAKLALVEFLLASDDLVTSARRALGWLADHAGVTRAVCAAADPDLTRLVGVAGHGVRADAVARFVVDLQARDHPLARAIAEGQPVTFPAAG